MTRRHVACAMAIAIGVLALGPSMRGQTKPAAAPTIVFDTAKGLIEVELFDTDAPKSVAHVLELVRKDFYRGLRFHWVQATVVQVGDPLSRNVTREEAWGTGGSGKSVGVAEISKRHFVRGSVGLAFRPGQAAADADSQIFILRAPNSNLDGKYTMLGQVSKGMDVVDKIEMSDILKTVRLKTEPAK